MIDKEKFKVGDCVFVTTYSGEHWGKVMEVLKSYSWSDETRYRVHGKELVTITSARKMRCEISAT